MKRIRRLLVVLALCGAFGTVQARTAELDEIRALADDGRTERALRRLEQFLAGRSDQLAGQLLRGVLLVELERTVEAERAFVLLRSQYPDRPELVNNLAVLQAASGRRATAIAALEEIVGLYPSYQTAGTNLEQIRLGMAGVDYDPLSPESSQAQLFLTAEPGSYARVDPPPTPAAAPVAATRPAEQPGERTRREPAVLASPPLPDPVPAAVAAEPAGDPPPMPHQAASPSPAPLAEATAPQPAAPTAPPPLSDTFRAEISQLVNDWAEAWSRQRVREYLDFYAADFQPTGFASRAAWETARRQRVATPEFIEVEADTEAMAVRRTGPDEASVTFVQRYRSNRFGDTVEKTLDLVREDGGWRIHRENSN